MRLDKKKILVVSHDAGGAEIISAWILKNPQNTYTYLLQGPAVKVFQRRNPKLTVIDEKEANDKLKESCFNIVLTGTSWESDLENNLIQKAKSSKITSISYLDHWVNHRERFGFPKQEWKNMLPSYIWCGDDECLNICKQLEFPEEKLALVPNEYFNEVIEEAQKNNTKEEPDSILYLCEPIQDHMIKQHNDAFHLGYTEFTAIDYFFSQINKLSKNPQRITIRQHPQERPGKYQDTIDKYKSKYQISVSSGETLDNEIQLHANIVGCSTMALVIGVLLKKKTFSTIPPGGTPSPLPFNQITYLRDL